MPQLLLPIFLVLVLAIPVLRADPVPVLKQEAPVPIKRMEAPYILAPLDKVIIIRADKAAETYQISQQGVIDLAGAAVKLQGLSPADARALLLKRLGNPAPASIGFDEFHSSRVTVLGEVYHQIYADMGEGPLRVLDAIAAANGFTALANTRRVKLVRENAGHVEVYELDLRSVLKGLESSQNILCQPGDVITVPRNFL